jgi:protein-S-isoprenylcysteine O-methyltransferase Ste14
MTKSLPIFHWISFMLAPKNHEPSTLAPNALSLVRHLAGSGAPFFLPGGIILPTLWKLLGLIPLAGGIIINLIADGAFHKAGTTVKPFQESTALITEGVFRMSRHPMYLGFLLVLIGVAMLLGSLTPWFIIPLFAILMDQLFIRVEEQMLLARFGQTWLNYKARVRRWL